jgi:drug/metabolite transporter, DME family
MPVVRETVNSASSKDRLGGVWMLVAASVLWSLSGVAVKVVRIDPIAFAFWRSLAAGVAMLLVLPFVTRRWPDVRWMTLSVLLYAMVVSLLITAMTRGTAASGILLQYTGPVFCALLAWIFERRRIGSRTALALVIASAGVAIMILGAGRDSRSGDVIGITCGALSGLAFGALILVLEKIDRISDVPPSPVAIVAINNLGCALLLAPICLVYGTIGAKPWQMNLVLATGVVQLGIPYLLFQLGLRRVPPVDASLLILLEPVLNPIWVWLAVAERPDVSTFIGGAAILVAMGIEATKKTLKSER